jgi:hypothetical protein
MFECRCDERLKAKFEGSTHLVYTERLKDTLQSFTHSVLPSTGEAVPVFYYESIKRELNKRLKFDSRCDARLKAEAEGCTRLAFIFSSR